MYIIIYILLNCSGKAAFLQLYSSVVAPVFFGVSCQIDIDIELLTKCTGRGGLKGGA